MKKAEKVARAIAEWQVANDKFRAQEGKAASLPLGSQERLDALEDRVHAEREAEIAYNAIEHYDKRRR